MISPNGQVVENGHTLLLFQKQCSVTKETFILKLPAKQVKEWVGGKLIQNVFPQLSPSEREFLITGFTPAEQDQL